jgi:hypothetical protein
MNFESTSTVDAADYDKDGDLDLFVGVRLKSFSYGLPMNGYILNNDGKGTFTNVTKEIAPELLKSGMITDALWADVDGDKDADLVVVGEYMPVKVYVNEKGLFKDATVAAGLGRSNGWWNRIKAADLDDDGDLDFVIGNHGLNSKFKASFERPLCMYVSDFDQNGSIEHLICTYNGEKSYPMILRHDLVNQIPSLKKKYLKYENFKNETLTDIFTAEQLQGAVKLNVYELRSMVAINDGHGKFTLRALPQEAQLSPVFGIAIKDFDNDGIVDILTGGNLYRVKPEVGRYDASYAALLKGEGNGNFQGVPFQKSGVNVDGEVRDILNLRSAKGDLVLFSRNNDAVIVYAAK